MVDLKTPAELSYARSDEWLRLEGDTATVGITDYAQNELNDIVYVELPEVGRELKQGEPFGVVESVKAASDVYAPVAGTVIEVNTALADQPELINNDPYGAGWLIKLRVTGQPDLSHLMTSDAYIAYNQTR